jgi:hypothetical protein
MVIIADDRATDGVQNQGALAPHVRRVVDDLRLPFGPREERVVEMLAAVRDMRSTGWFDLPRRIELGYRNVDLFLLPSSLRGHG